MRLDQRKLTTATAALAWSSSLRIGLGLMPVPLRNPALEAMEVATLARLFPGRFVPAAGHGVLPWMEQAGARAPSPMTLLREWVTATRSLLSGDVVTVSGQYVRLSGVVVNVLCAAGADSAERIEAELATSSQPLSSRAAVGSPEDVAETVRSFARAGATTVVLQPTAEDPDVAATIRLAAAAKTLLRNDSTVA